MPQITFSPHSQEPGKGQHTSCEAAEGYKALARGELALAEKIARQAIALNPADRSAVTLLAETTSHRDYQLLDNTRVHYSIINIIAIHVLFSAIVLVGLAGLIEVFILALRYGMYVKIPGYHPFKSHLKDGRLIDGLFLPCMLTLLGVFGWIKAASNIRLGRRC